MDAFVAVVNQLLPQFVLADRAVNRRSLEPINSRLVRFYASKRVLDRPLKEGKEARYLYHHLLQLLLIRRLLSEGYSLTAIAPITQGKIAGELEGLLQGGVQVTAETRNPALAFLHKVQARQSKPERSPQVSAAVPENAFAAEALAQMGMASPEDLSPNQWRHVEILPGLEIQIREDFVPPATVQEFSNLIHLIAHKLQTILNFKQVSR